MFPKDFFPAFSPFPTMFSKGFFPKVVKPGIIWLRIISEHGPTTQLPLTEFTHKKSYGYLLSLTIPVPHTCHNTWPSCGLQKTPKQLQQKSDCFACEISAQRNEIYRTLHTEITGY